MEDKALAEKGKELRLTFDQGDVIARLAPDRNPTFTRRRFYIRNANVTREIIADQPPQGQEQEEDLVVQGKGIASSICPATRVVTAVVNPRIDQRRLISS